MKEDPIAFIQTPDKVLHAYFSIEILVADLLNTRGEGIEVYKRVPGEGKLRFVPVVIEQMRADWVRKNFLEPAQADFDERTYSYETPEGDLL